MPIRITMSFVLLSIPGLGACGTKPASEPAATSVPAQESPEGSGKASASDDTAATHTDEASATVQVAREGTKFDPATKPEQIPDGAWMCEMGGTVHYAAMEQGDGKCPTCGMALKQKGGSHP